MMFRDKFKLTIKFALLLLIISLVFTGCRPVLQAKYVSSEVANEDMVFYMSEVEKLMNSKGYIKFGNLGSWTNIYEANYLDVYKLDDNMLLVFGTSWYDGKEKFFVDSLSATDEFLDKSVLNLQLVSEIIDIVSGCEFSKEYLSKFCDGAEYDDTGDYVNEKYLDYYGYYKLFYSVEQGGSIVPEILGNYGVYLSVKGLTVRGLKHT